MTESSNKTIGSCGFKSINLCVITGFAGDNPSFGDILNEAKSCTVKHDDEWFLDEDKVEQLQLKQRLQSVALRKDRELKKVEFEKELLE